jgi:signal transduction histidine kinase
MSRLKDGIFTHYGSKEGLPNRYILAFAEDSNGNLWVGTEGGGVVRFHENKIETVGKPGAIHSNVRSIFPDSKGDIWIGTYGGGLYRISNGLITSYSTQQGLAHNVVHAIAEDPSGVLWFGTNGGISKFKDGKFTNFGSTEGLSNNIVLSIYIDKEGILWIGTLGGGLNRFANGKFTVYTRANGLYDDAVAHILEGPNQNLWMTSNKGVFYVPKRELNEFALGKTKSIHSISYGVEDGMKSVECNGGSQPAGWRTVEGQLWFPTLRGAVMIDPGSNIFNSQKPPVHVEKVLADDNEIKNIQAGQKQDIPPGRKKLEFQYSAISLIDPQKVLFRYKLEGFDSEWNDAGTRRVAYYTNLPPGDYTFRVAACNNDGLWNETGAAFSFHLKPRFTQTPWFYLLCILAAGMVIWTIHRIRVRQVRNQVEARFAAVLTERARMGREIHDTLAQGLTGIAIRLEACRRVMPDVPQVVGDYLESARDLANSSLREARHLIQNLRPHFLLNTNLPTALQSLTQHLTAGTGIESSVHIFGNPIQLPETVENELVRICQEAVGNAVKHAQPKRIEVDLHYNNSHVELAIQDDGIGVQDSKNRPDSIGLISMKERVELIRGDFKMTSETGRGTRLLVSVPKQKS